MVYINNILGLNPIENDGRKHFIINYDMSWLIKGHLKYRDLIKEIMDEVDFDNDLKIFYNS